MSLPMQQTLAQLANGLRVGSIQLDAIKLTLRGDVVQDEQYIKFRMQQELNEVHGGPSAHEVVHRYIIKAEVPGVVEWQAKS